MRINNIDASTRKYSLAFKSIRTDKAQVAVLQNGTKPIGENQKMNILASINNLANSQDKANIEFLLGVADNLAYGQKGNSEFREALDKSGQTPTIRENTDWSKILETTILSAINNVKSDEIADLQEQFASIFADKKELTSLEKDILSKKEIFASKILSLEAIDDEETILTKAQIIKNLDYFVASSEISETQKNECLDKFLYLLSDDYEINPQLEDKKLLVIDEMLNDLLVQTPENDVLTIKGVNQRQSGICAAISICRKAIAYEDKTRYMDIVMAELDSSETMEVYDITELGSGKKVSLQKPVLDYDSAIAKGYRILDTSAHIWMQNAHTSGNGSILTETYTAFDDDTYNIYHDASWYEGLDDKYKPSKDLLKALIKEKEYLSAVGKRKKQYSQLSEKINSTKYKIAEEQGQIIGYMNTILSSIFSGVESSVVSKMAKNIITLCKGDDSQREVRMPKQLSDDLKQDILVEFVKEQIPSITEKQEQDLRLNSKKIISAANDYIQAEADIQKVKSLRTNRGMYRYYKNLYQSAAAHRLAIEADVNMPDGIVRYEKLVNLPPKDTRMVQYLTTLKSSFDSDKVRAKFKDLNGNVPTKKQLENEITEDIFFINTKLPLSLNLVMQDLYGADLTVLVSNLIKNVAESIANGDKESQSRFADVLSVKNDKHVVLSALQKHAEKLDGAPSSDDLQDAIRILGFDCTMHAAQIFVNSFFEQLQSGISEEQYNGLVERFGKDNISAGIENCGKLYSELAQEYQDVNEKWGVPSTRSVIIDKMEKSHSILSRKKLDKLQVKFDDIAAQMLENEKIEDLKERKKANEQACKFTKEELEIFNQIEKSLPYMRKYSKNTYKDINEYLFDELERQYSYIGMLNGQFWVREEGSSGLSANEQVRIIEQMTGKPYHIEYDVNDAAKQIKEGNGSGILSTSVTDDDYGFHAQYIPQVTSETFVDSKTKKVTKEDVLWTDNSWGPIENESYWNGRNGHYYTDYAGGYGWKDGFIVDSAFRIGQPLKVMHCATGRAGKEKEEFALFSDVVLPGTPTDVYQKLYKMFHNIFEMHELPTYVDAIEKAVEENKPIDIDFLVGIDDLAEAYSSKLDKRIRTEIKTKEDLDKLSDDDPVKIAMYQLSLYFATDNPQVRSMVYGIKNLSEVEEIKNAMFDEQVDVFAEIMGKSETNLEKIYLSNSKEFSGLYKELEQKFRVKLTEQQIKDINREIFLDDESAKNLDGSLRGLERYYKERIDVVADKVFKNKNAKKFFVENAKHLILKDIDENIRIKSLDSPMLTSSPLVKEFIAAVDKYLPTTSDEELLLNIQCLQEGDFEFSQQFIDSLSHEDVGLIYKEPYDYLRKFQIDDSLVTRAFSEIVATGFISETLGGDDDQAGDSVLISEMNPSDLYRVLHVKLADMDVQKYVRKFKAEAFTKYKVRQAFPQPVVFTDAEISETVNRLLETFREQVYSIKGNQYVLELLEKKDKFAEKYANSEVYNALANGQNVDTEANKEELVTMLNDLILIREHIAKDNSLKILEEPYSNVISIIQNSNGMVDARQASLQIREINRIFEEWEASSANQNKFAQNIKEQQAELKENIRVFVESSIDPKYKDEATNRIKEIINLERKEASREKIDALVDEFYQFVIDKHITKNPTVLLQETIKCLQKGNKESQEYSVLKTYLLAALKVAQQTKIQYKLVQNQHEGIGSKTKDLLPMFKVTMSDGSSRPMESKEGMVYLIEQLRNQGDNNVTLNLFLEQSGLTENAVNALIDNFDLEQSKKLVDENAQLVVTSLQEIMYLGEILNDYFNKSRINYKSFDDACNQINKYVKRKTKHISSSPMVTNFIKYMDQVQIKDGSVPLNTQMFKEVLASATNSALDFLSENINYKIEFLESIPALMNERLELLYAIKVAENSDAYTRREDFAVEFEKNNEYMNNVIAQVYALINASQEKMNAIESGV